MSTFWPLSQIWSSVKSLLMTAVVVVFNWKRKHRVTSHARAHQAPFPPQAFFAMAHHNCPLRDRDSLAGEQEVMTKAGRGQAVGRLSPRPGLPTHLPQ